MIFSVAFGYSKGVAALSSLGYRAGVAALLPLGERVGGAQRIWAVMVIEVRSSDSSPTHPGLSIDMSHDQFPTKLAKRI